MGTAVALFHRQFYRYYAGIVPFVCSVLCLPISVAWRKKGGESVERGRSRVVVVRDLGHGGNARTHAV
jgi:hypothetical protein